ncbi:putative sporulation protein YtxC [Paenibacillus allorhizosphaerae]|uniref:Sporulation protein YtxC n=1 Tax=Paenibacillus allorhizosphaerae TaxID=2849866 RepID=A0ABM8VEX9_9BACL|nr:putative sporulation protein YtxC [Paenibacillus allorhizosphaerae]CAG7632939.1 hypothetical protein PAECIP111802_01895 [Paenibacillus allorhizosphaerae]
MKLFTIHLTNRVEAQAGQLFGIVSSASERLHNKDYIHISMNRHEGMHLIEVSGVLPGFQLQTDGDPLFEWAGNAIADYILLVEERHILRHLLKQEFHYDKEEDMDRIMSYCEQMLSGTGEWEGEKAAGDVYLRRKAKISAELAEYLKEHTDLNLEGYLRFRLHAYIDELRDVAEYAVDEFVMDRQYQEFISLLQYFVYIQEARIPFVHLIHKGGNDFLLLNDRMEQINTDDPEAVVTVEMLEKDMNFEDMIVSTLISVSPQQIYIHTREPELQVIHTIQQIFENRVEVCGYCRLCHNLDRGAAAEYNKR